LIQFCDAEAGAGAPSSKLLIKGGTVVNAHHQQVADVYIEDGIIVAIKPTIAVYFLSLLNVSAFFVMCLSLY